jgi:hypothetical protein
MNRHATHGHLSAFEAMEHRRARDDFAARIEDHQRAVMHPHTAAIRAGQMFADTQLTTTFDRYPGQYLPYLRRASRGHERAHDLYRERERMDSAYNAGVMRLVSALLLFVLVSCHATPSPKPEAVVVAPTPKPTPPNLTRVNIRDADVRAREAVGAQVWAMLDLEAMRPHRSGVALADLLVGMRAFRHIGFDPIDQGVRAFVAARGAGNDEDWIIVVEHSAKKLGEEFVRETTDAQPLEHAQVPALLLKRRPTVLLLPQPNILVLTSLRHAEQAADLKDSAGLPEPQNGVSIRADTISPATSLHGRRMPDVPATISRGHGILRFSNDGGARVYFEGRSASPEQAIEDATTMNELLDDISVGIGPFRVKLARRFEFRAKGDSISAGRELSPEQADLFLDLMLGLSRRHHRR